nr:peptidase family M48 family protein [Tanacetum cinerariifolium]
MVTTLTSSDSTSGLNNQSLLVQNLLFLHTFDRPALPSVETACTLLQQEESQKEVFGSGQLGVESIALYSKGKTKDKCTIYGFKWHSPEKCWEKVAYLTWHHKYKQNQKAKGGMKSGNAPVKRTATLVENGGHVVFTSKQFKQLLKSLSHFYQNGETAPQDLKTRKVLGLGKKKAGLYHLINLPLEQIHAQLSSMVVYALEDCSLNVWTYLLIKKYDAYSLFKSFIKFVNTQFERDIKVVRSDNAIKFLKGSLGPLMDSLGIHHQTSCVDRPQQNGRVERRNRNILEIGDYILTFLYTIGEIV